MGSTLAAGLLVLGWLPMVFGVRRGRAPAGVSRASRQGERPADDELPPRRARAALRFADRIQLLLTWVACIAVTILALRGVQRAPDPVRLASGTGLFLAGVGFWLWARRAHGTEYAQLPRVPATLVTTGPYRVVRHPLYLATIAAAAGQAIAAGTWAAGAIAIGLAIQLATRAAREEGLLARSLGPAWTTYADRVRPGLPTRRHDRARL